MVNKHPMAWGGLCILLDVYQALAQQENDNGEESVAWCSLLEHLCENQ